MDLRSVKRSRMPLADEPNLVRQAKKGNSESCGTLNDAYLERIYRLGYFSVGDQQKTWAGFRSVVHRSWPGCIQ